MSSSTWRSWDSAPWAAGFRTGAGSEPDQIGGRTADSDPTAARKEKRLTHQLDITLEQRQTREAEFYNRLYARPATWEDVRRCGRFPYTRQFIRTLGDCRE